MGPEQSQLEWRALVLAAALVAGVSYLVSDSLTLPPFAAIAWKGAGVGLLALYAGLMAKSLDGWSITVVMAFGASGDVLLETHGLTVGALAFLAGHGVAIYLYLRHRRRGARFAEVAFLAIGVMGTVALAASLPSDRASAPGIALYALGLSTMAAAAWMSRFPRHRVALGAMMFVISDLLIFARAGPAAGMVWIGPAIWTLYFGGQALVRAGVSAALAQRAGRQLP